MAGKGVVRAVLMAGAGAALLSMAWPASAAVPIEAYGRLPAISDVRLSPDATRIAYIGAIQDDTVVTIFRRDGAGKPTLLRLGRAKLRAIEWADDGHLVITSSTTDATPLGIEFAATREYLHAIVYDLARDRTVLVQPPAEARGENVVLGAPVVRTVGGRRLLFFKSTTPHEQHAVPTLFQMDVASGAVRQLDQGNLALRDFAVGPDGTEIAQTFFSGGQWTVKVKTPAGWQGAVFDASIDVPALEGLGPRPDTVIIANAPRADGAEGRAARVLSLKTGALTTDTVAGTVLHDPQTGLALVSRVQNETGARYRFFDPAAQAHWNAILKAFPGEQVDFESVSADNKVWVVQVYGPTTGAAHMLVDLATGKGELLGDIYKDLTPGELSSTKLIRYPAADGLVIPAYLTTPNGRDAKGLPLIVLPHGAVAGRDTADFNWLVQALASRGYAVLQPQYRGSGGFGAELRQKGYGEWGAKMRTDLSDGVHALAAQGVIDPRRVCIVGENYGGYAALAGAALEAKTYRCAVSIGGIADPVRLVAWQKEKSLGQYTPAVPFLERYLGQGAPNPVNLASQMSIPVLLIHGRDDTVAPFDEAQAMASALQGAHKSVQLVALTGEDHWLSRSDTRLQALQATLQFLQANNPADASAAAVASK